MTAARALRLLLLAIVASLVAAPAATADRTAEVGIEDEAVAISSGEIGGIAPLWRALGIDSVRVQAYWDFVSPNNTRTVKPAGFSIANQRDPRYRWGELDRAVNTIVANHMKPLLTINQVGPVWASTRPSHHSGSYKVDPAKYAQFASAVAKRYGSRVGIYLAGNEPNQKTSLYPQVVCTRSHGRRTCEHTGGSLYRNLVNAAYPVIKRADPTAKVLMGEMAPIGGAGTSNNSSLKPLPFIRSMACVDKLYRPIRTGLCRHFTPARADGFGYHPYQQKARPSQPTADRDLAKLGDTKRLFRVLDLLTVQRRLRPTTRRFNLYYTEFAYETTPGEPKFGVSPRQQSAYLQQSAYIAWSTPRLKLLTQYQWFDEQTPQPLNPSGSNPGFQSGLLFVTRKPKPALFTFPNPFFVDVSKGIARARFWGQVRPGGAHRVTLQQKTASGQFANLGAPMSTDGRGYWTRVLPAHRGATYRYIYTAPTGGAVQGTSDTFVVH
jgi:hypothetical protein